MGNIMISLDDEQEKKARELAQQIYGGKKGSLSQVFNQAIKAYVKALEMTKQKTDARKRIIERLEKGLDIGYTRYTKRSETYDHRTKASSGY